jgi:hypothetical protein
VSANAKGSPGLAFLARAGGPNIDFVVLCHASTPPTGDTPSLASSRAGSRHPTMGPIEQKTGTSNRAYDLVSVLYHALQGAETYDRYVADAEANGDAELAAFFRDVQDKDRVIADRAKRLLHERLDV